MTTVSFRYRIGPFEVESALMEHPAVVESAVVVKAFIILSPAFLSHDPEALIQELQNHLKKSTAPYKYPRKASGSGKTAEKND
ncbi:Acyl-coenzyme A synthetase ACSM5, mitochondrial, partial [Ophiophagus hannah]